MGRDIYPIGKLDFKNICDNDTLYVDKTQYIDKLAKSQSRYFFQARLRLFGLSTPLPRPAQSKIGKSNNLIMHEKDNSNVTFYIHLIAS